MSVLREHIVGLCEPEENWISDVKSTRCFWIPPVMKDNVLPHFQVVRLRFPWHFVVRPIVRSFRESMLKLGAEGKQAWYVVSISITTRSDLTFVDQSSAETNNWTYMTSCPSLIA